MGSGDFRGPAFPGKYLVYINGVRVPAQSVTVSNQPWEGIQAQIAVAPHRFIARLGAEDRAQVAVFYLDVWHTPKSPKWCLLFEGEIFSWQYSNSHLNRSIVFLAQSGLNVLKDLFLCLLSGNSNAYGGKSITQAKHPNQHVLKGKYPSQFFTVGTRGRSMISRPYDIVENILYAVLGSHREKNPKGKAPAYSNLTKLDAKLSELESKLRAVSAELSGLADVSDEDPQWVRLNKKKLALDNQIEALRTQRTALLVKANATGVDDEVEEMSSLISEQREKRIERWVNHELSIKKKGVDSSEIAALKKTIEKEITEKVEASDKEDAETQIKLLKKQKLVPSGYSVEGKKLEDVQTFILRKKALQKLAARSYQTRSIAQTGFFARHMRLIRFLEKWVPSPYVEGRPRAKDPLNAIKGGGVFPLLRSANATKVFHAMARQAGVKYGQQASAFGLLRGIFSALYYDVVEITAPPALTLDKYGLPVGTLNSSAPGGAPGEPPVMSYEQYRDKQWKLSETYPAWASKLDGEKKRLSIGSFLTKPQTAFAIPPNCNAFYPSTWINWNYSESYRDYPTRVYYNRRGPLTKLNMSGSLPGYAYNSTRVGYPAVVERHMQDAREKGTGDMNFLVFPEEYYLGPRPHIKDVDMMFTNLQTTANMRRFSRKSYKPKAEWKESVQTKDNPVLADQMSKSIDAIERANRRGNSMQALYFLLAQKEYSEAKYAQRAGNIQSVFNPYVIPGFPMTLLDSKSVGVNVFGLVNSVTHSLGESGLSTTVTFSHGRTYEEMFESLYQDGPGLDIAPMDPFHEMRDIFQYMPQAHTYYSHLFDQDVLPADATDETLTSGQINGNRAYGFGAFDYRVVLGWKVGDEKPDANKIVTRDLSDDVLPEFFKGTKYDPPKSGVRLNTPVAPLSHAESLYENAETALHYGSRSVCTLEDYINFYGVAGRGGANLDPVGRGRGIRYGFRDEPDVPPYYDVIRQFVGGPGVEPGARLADAVKLKNNPDINSDSPGLKLTVIGEKDREVEFTEISHGKRVKFKDLPDSRKDWQQALMQYLYSVFSTGNTSDGPDEVIPSME